MVSITESSLLASVTQSQSLLNAKSLGGSSTVLMGQNLSIIATGGSRTHGVKVGAMKDSCAFRSRMAVESAE